MTSEMMRMLTGNLIGCVALVACGGSGSEPQPEPQPSLSFISGASQTDTVGRTLPAPLQVQLTDTNSGAPLVGYVINWSVIDRGSLNVLVTQTGANGITSNVFTLGTITGATHGVVAQYLDPQTAAPLTVDTAYFTALPALAASIVLTPGVTQFPTAIHVGDTATYDVAYWDSFGNSGAPCPAGVTWESLVWVYDTALVRLVDITRTVGGAATRFQAVHTGGAQFTVTTDCALAIRTVSTTYSLPINP